MNLQTPSPHPLAPPQKKNSQKRRNSIKNGIILLNGRQNVFNAFESRAFPKQAQEKGVPHILGKVSYRKQLTILTPKQMLQRLPIALAQVKSTHLKNY